jgi:hypothetical protein
MASVCRMDLFVDAGIVVISEPMACQTLKLVEFRKSCSCKSLLQPVAVLDWLRPSAAGDGRRLTLAVTFSAPLGILSVQLTSDVTLLAPVSPPLLPNALTRVAGSTISFVATVTAANSALLTLIYDRQPDNVRHTTSPASHARSSWVLARLSIFSSCWSSQRSVALSLPSWLCTVADPGWWCGCRGP